MQKVKAKKIGSIILNVLLYIFLAICICSVFMTVFAKRSNGAAELFGYQMRIVTSDSMAECELTDVSGYEIKDIPVRSMIFIKMMNMSRRWHVMTIEKSQKCRSIIKMIYTGFSRRRNLIFCRL